MLQDLKTLLSELFPSETITESAEQLKYLAAAALMVEVATIDENFDESELEALIKELKKQFGLSGQALDNLVNQAHKKSREATSLFQFTHAVNDQLSHNEKFELLTGMWRVAYADGSLDRHEEHIIRRIADLIHVPHSQFIRAKQTARDTQ